MISFARNRFHVLLSVGLVAAVSSTVSYVANILISGRMLGADSVSASAVIYPVVSGGVFLDMLVSGGAAYLYSRYQGEFKSERAREVLGTALFTTLATGFLLAVAMTLGRDAFLGLYNLSRPVYEEATRLWFWQTINLGTCPPIFLIWVLVIADGEVCWCVIGDAINMLVVILGSVLFTRLTHSAAGAIISVIIGAVLSAASLTPHFFKRSNSIHFKLFFSFRDLRELLSYAMSGSCARICNAVLVLVLNGMVVHLSSSANLPAVGMVMLTIEFGILLNRIGVSYMPVAEMYRGEENWGCVRSLARYATAVSGLVGLLILAFVCAFSRQIVGFCGITDPAVGTVARHALLITAAALPVMSVFDFLCAHYLVMERVGMSTLFTVLEKLVFCSAGALLGGILLGVDGIWIGLAGGCAVSLALLVAYTRLFHRQTYPLLIPAEKSSVLNVAFHPSVKRIIEIRRLAEKFLTSQHVPRPVVLRIMLMIEECAMLLIDNNGRKAEKMVAEGSFSVFPDHTQVVFRDTGSTYDITDGDTRVRGLRDFVIAELMQKRTDRRYLNTVGCNRATFAFPHTAAVKSKG